MRGADLRSGSVTSCGCVKDAKTSERFKTHGMSNTLIYDIWSSMKGRCFRKTSKDYPNYGGRGITMCEEWINDFRVFYSWAIKNGYLEHLTIERRDPNGNYEPDNCSWIKNEEQSLNRRNTRVYEYQGRSFSARELSETLGVNYNTLRDYLNKGKSIAEIERVSNHA